LLNIHRHQLALVGVTVRCVTCRFLTPEIAGSRGRAAAAPRCAVPCWRYDCPSSISCWSCFSSSL
jgi:hypothetical protein